MNAYTIARAPSQSPDWGEIPALEVSCRLWTQPVDIAMTAQLCYTPDALLLHLRVREADIRADHTVPLSMVCEDSCMEFFFCPRPDDPRYFNFEINPNGCTYIGFGTGRGDSVRLIPKDEDALFSKTVRRCDGGWEVFFAIPVTFVRVFFPDFALEPGTILRANCFKCGDLTIHPHYFSWNPVQSETPDFHRPQDFGSMCLA